MALLNVANMNALTSNDDMHDTQTSSHLGDLSNTTASAVSWAAIFAGAAAAAALSLILLILGTGLGLSAVSPWAFSGISAITIGFSAIIWLAFTQIIAYGMGGYIAGRLRTKWADAHVDEVYFRDTAHGFLTWAIASLATAALLSSVISAIVGTGVKASTSLVGTTLANMSANPSNTDANNKLSYFVDSLFRKAPNSDVTPSADNNLNATAEFSNIFKHTLNTGKLSAEDTQYMGNVVAARTGLDQADAEKRVAETYTSVQTNLRITEIAAKEAADNARRATAYAALWLFVSLLIGAFSASLAATYGGRCRDA